MTQVWGERIRLKGGYLAHYAGKELRGVRLLAHDDLAWADRCVPLAEDDPRADCRRCVDQLPEMARVRKLIDERFGITADPWGGTQ